jgi:hypothetical protein
MPTRFVSLVRLPLEHRVEYVRRADLRPGLVWYPLLAVFSLAAILVADWAYVHDRGLPALAAPLDLTTLLVTAGVIRTAGAAPTLLRLRRASSPAAGRVVFARFHRWGLIRAVCQTLAFPSGLWPLMEVLGVRHAGLF